MSKIIKHLLNEYAMHCRFTEVTHVEDQTCEKNPVLLFARIVVRGLFIELSQLSKDKAEIPYLMLRLDRACVDVTMAEFTVGVQAQLGSVQLIDKQNLGLTCFLRFFTFASSI